MSFMQLDGSWVGYVAVLVPFTAVSLVISFNLHLVYSALAWIRRRIRIKLPMVNNLSQLEAGLPVHEKRV